LEREHNNHRWETGIAIGYSEQANSFVIRFLPSGYLAPHRIAHNLSDRQRIILQSLSTAFNKGLTFAEIKSKFQNPPADRALRDDFQHLKRLGLLQVSGIGRGAKWSLISTN
jgi:ATP-dependent DNA helicase RecG